MSYTPAFRLAVPAELFDAARDAVGAPRASKGEITRLALARLAGVAVPELPKGGRPRKSRETGAQDRSEQVSDQAVTDSGTDSDHAETAA